MQVPGGAQDAPEIGGELPELQAVCLLGQELAVADQRGHRRQQLLAHVGKPRPALAIGDHGGLGHGRRPAPSRRSIFSSRRAISTGLVS